MAKIKMILEGHLFLRLSLGFVRKILIFVGNHLSFYSKDTCSILVFLCLNENELIQQVCQIKHIDNEISNSTFHKTKNKREEQKHKPTSNSSFLKLLINCR